MNELSWMIYAADICEKVGSTAAFIAGLGTVGAGIGQVLWMVELRRSDGPQFFPHSGKIVSILVAALVVSILTPSSTTIYAIAASETGERLANTETAGKAVQALNAWLDRQIAADSTEQDQ